MARARPGGIGTGGDAVTSAVAADQLAVLGEGATPQVALRHPGPGLCRSGRQRQGDRR